MTMVPDWQSRTLNTQGLCVARAGVMVLEDLNFSLVAGQALVLRGPNGLGKTTLLRTLAGLQPPLSGYVSNWQDDLSYAAHADGLKSVLSVQENLSFWAEVYGHSAVTAAMEAMNLTALSRHRAAELSAGQKRRLGLARLLVTGRWLWLLDEPTVSLDAASVALFVGVVRAHLARGGAAIIATHVDLGLPEARLLDLSPHRARTNAPAPGGFDEAFT
jgi:heme exporter protein A